MYCFTRYLLRTVKVASIRVLPVVERQTRSCRKALYLSPQHSISSSSPALSVENDLKKNKIKIKKPLLEGKFNQETATEYLSNLNEEDKKRLKLYKLEYEMWLSSGLSVPFEMLDEWWAELLYSCYTMSSRKKTYRYFKKLEIYKELKIERRNKVDQLKLEKSDGMKRSVNTIFLKLIKSTQMKYYYARCAQAMIFGRPFVVDMSYESYMSNKDTRSFIDQLLEGYGNNHHRLEPCDLVLTNFDPNGFVFKKICYLHQTPDCLFAKTSEQSYVDLFPKERLVYLSPHAEDELLEDDEDNIYIIGGFVDTGREAHRPLSYARAQKDNIRTARLPIDRYLLWKQGSKSLTINQTMDIMIEFMHTKDWNKAFRCVPKRKIMTEQDTRERKFRRPKHFKPSRQFDEYY